MQETTTGYQHAARRKTHRHESENNGQQRLADFKNAQLAWAGSISKLFSTIVAEQRADIRESPSSEPIAASTATPGAVLNLRAREALSNAIHAVIGGGVTSNFTINDEENLKMIKKLSKESDEICQSAWELLLIQLGNRKFRNRQVALCIIDHLFDRSHVIRQCVAFEIADVMHLCIGHRKQAVIQKFAIECIIRWDEKSGHVYRQVCY